MFTRDQIAGMALALPNTRSDQPFDDDFDSTVFRHVDTGKWFALLFAAPCAKVGLDREGTADILNLKCDPMVSFGLAQSYPDILPAYHMNKHHWISVRLEGDVPEETMRMLIEMSYDLTRRKPGRRRPVSEMEVEP